MERKEPDVYHRIVEADRASRLFRGGHGNALAQVYNHIIMPLAPHRDSETQVIWGIKDFSHRFGRLPEGMWLAETAADSDTLEILATHGIKFTILSPTQAWAVRPARRATDRPDGHDPYVERGVGKCFGRAGGPQSPLSVAIQKRRGIGPLFLRCADFSGGGF
jgi:predicted glycosyl hydrolase (DUF1957 family)